MATEHAAMKAVPQRRTGVFSVEYDLRKCEYPRGERLLYGVFQFAVTERASIGDRALYRLAGIIFFDGLLLAVRINQDHTRAECHFAGNAVD